MNKRIKELAVQADKLTVQYANENNVNCIDAFNIVFAELIVLECVEKLKETKKVELPFLQATNETIQELPLSVYITELKQHFGVEE